MDFALLGAFYYTATTGIPRINPVDLPSRLAPWTYPVARFIAWQVYGVAAGLVGTGLWIIAHECGHQAFSTSKTLNNSVGWVLHSALGVPYHSWRISHAKHHAATSHCTRDEAYVPRTRSERGLPRIDEVQGELWDALGESPGGAALGVFALLVCPLLFYMFVLMSASCLAGRCTCSRTSLDNAPIPSGRTISCPRLRCLPRISFGRLFGRMWGFLCGWVGLGGGRRLGGLERCLGCIWCLIYGSTTG